MARPTSRTASLAPTLLAAALGLAGCASEDPAPVNPSGVRCGNTIIEGIEECDDGNTTPGDGCNGSCRLEDDGPAAVCGDGVVGAGEGCDDGDTMPDDGCGATCATEAGFTCAGAPSVCTPTAPSDPVPPAAGDLVINEYLAQDGTAADTNCDGTAAGTGDEFVELVNASTKTLDLTGLELHDDTTFPAGTPRLTFAAAATGSLTLAPGQAVVVWGGGSPACAGVSSFFVTGAQGLSLNDAADTIRVVLPAAGGDVTIAERAYTASTREVSATRDPEITGTAYIDHPALTGGARWSPGRRRDGSAF